MACAWVCLVVYSIGQTYLCLCLNHKVFTGLKVGIQSHTRAKHDLCHWAGALALWSSLKEGASSSGSLAFSEALWLVGPLWSQNLGISFLFLRRALCNLEFALGSVDI